MPLPMEEFQSTHITALSEYLEICFIFLRRGAVLSCSLRGNRLCIFSWKTGLFEQQFYLFICQPFCDLCFCSHTIQTHSVTQANRSNKTKSRDDIAAKFWAKLERSHFDKRESLFALTCAVKTQLRVKTVHSLGTLLAQPNENVVRGMGFDLSCNPVRSVLLNRSLIILTEIYFTLNTFGTRDRWWLIWNNQSEVIIHTEIHDNIIKNSVIWDCDLSVSSVWVVRANTSYNT